MSARVPFRKSLSGRLLLLSALFVLLGEVLIYVPSIARYRLVFLQERLAAGHIATLALEATPDGRLAPALVQRLLDHAMVDAVVLRTEERSDFMLSQDMPPAIDASYDLRDASAATLILDAFGALIDGPSPTIRVLGTSHVKPNTVVEVVLGQAAMHKEMVGFSRRILTLSIVISLLTAGLVYVSLHLMMVRPLRGITDNLTRFRRNPEDAASQIEDTKRGDEIGVAQEALGQMQRELRRALLQKTRLAALGAAMGKINHDLRNTLASAMVVSDSLSQSDDPIVQKVTPRLMSAMDRAVTLCRSTLNYAQSDEPELEPKVLNLSTMVDDVGEMVVTDTGSPVKWINRVPEAMTIRADHIQFFRVLQNLGQNAVQSMPDGGTVTIGAAHETDQAVIEFIDTGPGISDRAREHLFQPFAASSNDAGSGLGLAIARENMRLHGGDIALVETGEMGTHFRLTLPTSVAKP
ncbi:MAG: HAMP domain-containing sensor histidine kinase [Alphaproteobacteria bacterium]|nr:HAMP domain-containing sensor histidine kinase [Alphaproteobacteria bacterium]